MIPPQHLVLVATTDLAAITRGRAVPESRFEGVAARGVGWVPANLCITAFGTIPERNPWGSSGDLVLRPDLSARFRTSATGTATGLDLVMGDLEELDGTPWAACPRNQLRQALADLRGAAGFSMVASFEHEFQALDAPWPAAHPFGIAGLRRADPFAPRLMAALGEAGIEPELVFAEYGRDQFEVTCAPAEGLVAADRAVALREITRELARSLGFRASFAPKTAPDAVGNGVHIHFSFLDGEGRPATYDSDRPGGLSDRAASFCAGVIRHMPALTALTAPSVPSYLRLKPHSWSASYTWLASQDREASLRICPVVGRDDEERARRYNVEYRASDATANPYLALAAIVRAGLAGIEERLAPPPIVAGDPAAMSEEERTRLGLVRLPQSLADALAAFAADKAARRWFPPALVESFITVKEAEIAATSGRPVLEVCESFSAMY